MEGSAPNSFQEALSQPQTFNEYFERQEQWTKEIFEVKYWPEDLTEIIQCIQTGTLEMVADGSYKKSSKLSTAAWIVTTPTSSIECQGVAEVPGEQSIQESYRAEIYGILCIMSSIDMIASYYNIEQGTVTIACDNVEAGKNSILATKKQSAKGKRFDLLHKTWTTRKHSKLTWKYKHVKGHQDRCGRPLDRLATLKIRMDQTTKRYMRHIENLPNRTMPTQQIPNQWSLTCNDSKITGKTKDALIHHIHGRTLKHHFVRSQKMSARATTLINWPAIEKANKKLSSIDSIWITKFVSRFSATGKNMQRWNKWEHSRCPRCGEAQEDTLHVLVCDDDEAKENLYESVTEFEIWMEKYGTHPAIRNIFTTTILERRQTSFTATARFLLFNDNTHSGHLIQQAAMEQDEIGWLNTLEGKISSTWEEAQDEYYKITKENKKTGLTWSAWMIKKLYTITKAQWTHRNEVLHLQTAFQASQEELAQLKSEIRKEFEIGDDTILVNDIALFTVSEEDVRLFTVDEQKAWLKSVYIARKRADPNYKPPHPLHRYDG